MRPNQMREELDGSVQRSGLSPESYQKLEEANGAEELKEVLLEIFEPSRNQDGGG